MLFNRIFARHTPVATRALATTYRAKDTNSYAVEIKKHLYTKGHVDLSVYFKNYESLAAKFYSNLPKVSKSVDVGTCDWVYKENEEPLWPFLNIPEVYMLISLARSLKRKNQRTELILNQTSHLMQPVANFVNRLHVDRFPWHITWPNKKGFQLYADVSNHGQDYLMTIKDGHENHGPSIWLNRDSLQGDQVKSFVRHYIVKDKLKPIYTKNNGRLELLNDKEAHQALASALNNTQISFLHCVGDPGMLENRSTLIIR